jgi:hypothetical protein
MARYWLDAARYGDTHGLHLDNYRELWPYRDWVISAYNRNMPFDQFTVEQLAGDLLPEPTLQQRIATGFNRCNVTTSEGGSIDAEYYVRYAVDRTSTVATVWMGLTAGCAQCHDHKYDPLTQREFYQLYAFFNNNAENAMDGNRKDTPPIVKVPTAEQKEQLAGLDGKIAGLTERVRAPMPHVEAAQAAWEAVLPRWTPLLPTQATSSGGATLTVLDDRSVLASGENPDKDTFEAVAELTGEAYTALRLEALLDKSLPKGGAGRSENSNAVLSELEVEIASKDKPDEWHPAPLVHAWADFEQDGSSVATNALDGKADTGWSIAGHVRKENREAIFLAAAPFGDANGSLVRVRLKHESQFQQHTIGRFRLSVTRAPALSPMGAALTLDDWYSLGPFSGHSGDTVFHQKFEPEGKGVNLGQEFKVGDASLKWTRQGAWTDGAFHGGLSGEHAATYVYRNIRSDARQRVTLRIAADDALRVWLNQQEVFARNGEGDASALYERVQVELRPGNNELVMKVVNLTGDAGFSFALDADPPIAPADVADAAGVAPDQRSDDQRARVRDYYRENISTDPTVRKFLAERREVQRERNELDAQVATTLVMEERTERRPARILARGQYDKPGDEVAPATPAFLPAYPEDAPRNRVGFARWLLDPSHPLTARVTVNRLWQQVFGTGIVRTSEDFGNQGERPTHPELLDWLATEFVRSGWDVQAMLKLLVTSETYMQSAHATAEVVRRDPRNRLYARGPRFRLDAEMMRDQALAVGGLLRPVIGGPSVKPPQPPGLWEAVGYVGSNTRTFSKDTGPDKVYRRSLYTFWKRTASPPQMNLLDAPSREACTVRRERTNTPLQALMLMNDPQYVEAARALAERTIKEGGTAPEDRIAFVFETATARMPRADELTVLRDTLEQHLDEMRADPDAAKKLVAVGEGPPDEKLDAAELAAWTMLANLILNLDEVINKG